MTCEVKEKKMDAHVGYSFNCDGGSPPEVIDWMTKFGSTSTCCSPYDMFRGGPIIGKCPLTHDRCVR